MAEFQHFVLTNFNVRRAEFTHDKHGRPVLSDEWMAQRVVLFERFCYPSMQNQTNKNFLWLVRFDESTSPMYRRLTDSYRAFENFTPIYTPTRFRDAIKTNLDGDTEFLITTRLDNDDAFHRETIDTIQRHFRRQDFEFLTFPVGYQYLVPEGLVYGVRSLNNHYPTLVEKLTNKPFKTVRFEDHRRLPAHGPVTQMGDAPFWLTVVHERNSSNRVSGTPCSPGALSGLFGIKIER